MGVMSRFVPSATSYKPLRLCKKSYRPRWASLIFRFAPRLIRLLPGAQRFPLQERARNEGVKAIMTAIIETGGKQFKVAEGDTLFIEKLDVNAGDSLTFDKVLAVIDGDKATFGAPMVEGAKVEASVVKNGKGKKIRIFKYNPKKGYRKRQGHRQPYTKVTIGKISV